jgi:hypothetical protein
MWNLHEKKLITCIISPHKWMITSIPLYMVCLVGEELSLVHQIQRKGLNISNIGCKKYQPKDILALLSLCAGSE